MNNTNGSESRKTERCLQFKSWRIETKINKPIFAVHAKRREKLTVPYLNGFISTYGTDTGTYRYVPYSTVPDVRNGGDRTEDVDCHPLHA